ncbi:hypothetical protein [Candidatus Pantoea multigeneris]|nr:hypothetical protein [Pantoea multigeneris]
MIHKITSLMRLAAQAGNFNTSINGAGFFAGWQERKFAYQPGVTLY